MLKQLDFIQLTLPETRLHSFSTVRPLMDFISLGIGFISGAVAGAAGNYFADRFTDARRTRKLAREQTKLWKDIERRFSAVISEMRADFSGPEGKHVRTFFVKASNTTIGFISEPCFEYHTDKHPEITAAVSHLARHGFITDITPGNCPMYRVHEHLVDRLLH